MGRANQVAATAVVTDEDAKSVAGLIDSTLDELGAQLRALKREVVTLEAFRRQLLDVAEERPAAAERDVPGAGRGLGLQFVSCRDL